MIWYHDGRPVKESPDFQLLFQGDRCSLVIQDALPEDAGEYKVVSWYSSSFMPYLNQLFIVETDSRRFFGFFVYKKFCLKKRQNFLAYLITD